jgi:hypothetical protein
LSRISAIVVVGDSIQKSFGSRETDALKSGSVFQTPLAFLELLGSSALQRTLAQLQSAELESIRVIVSELPTKNLLLTPGVTFETAPASDAVWDRVFSRAKEIADSGIDMLLVIRLGAYVEFDLERLVLNHRERGKGLTRLYDQGGPLEIWLADGERIRKSQHLTSARELLTDRPSRYAACTYVNRLESLPDLRRLAVDILLMRCDTKPGGAQTRPGVWIDEGAVVDKSVRLVGPSYVGRGARIRSSVLLTRFSHVEGHCEIDYGTAVEDSSILSNTYIGPSLDVTHAVVSGSHITHLHKNVALEILDPLLVGKTLSGATTEPMQHRARAAHWVERLIQTSS